MYEDFNELKGKTLSKITVHEHDGDDEIRFFTTDGKEYRMNHDQDCCESVTIDDIDGDPQDLVGDEILLAEERSDSYGYGDTIPAELLADQDYPPESCTWTFYVIRTINASITIRWFGESNGYYSEGVSFNEIKES